jgi:lipopolysaccharide/colanic/teichoic acid biosynthesis glycosyltransferase
MESYQTIMAVSEGHKKESLTVNIQQGFFYLFCKRLMDIIFSIIGIFLLSPLFLIVVIAIKIGDPMGKIIFSQKRVGKNGKEFNMYKFRSMVTNAEEILDSLMHRNETIGPMFKIKEDPRVTKIGRIIRKTSIDELPQLWNVVKGDMSLVGPRPPLPREVKEYSEFDKQRLLVVPGCTGLWQISGRSSLGFKEMVMLDLEYISKRNFWYDLYLIVRTIDVMFGSKDAY